MIKKRLIFFICLLLLIPSISIPLTTETAQATTITKFNATGIVTTNSSSLNVRQSASTTSKVIGTVAKGSMVTIFEKTDGWYRIYISNTSGWVSADYIKISTPPPQVKPNSNGYSDNPLIVYYQISNAAYEGVQIADGKKTKENISSQLNVFLNGTNNYKYKIIDAISTDKKDNHEAGTLSYPTSKNKVSLDKTGLNAITVVAEESKKLWVSIAGSKNALDYKTALYHANNIAPTGQEMQLMLYMNYIYEKYPQYRSYNWYLTGHSLGGNLATKVYLNTRAAKWLIADKSKFKYGGPFQHTISGVYTFNTLSITQGSIPNIQWNANLTGTYNKEVYNLVIDNEWLHAYQKLSLGKAAYIGTVGIIQTSKKLQMAINNDYNLILKPQNVGDWSVTKPKPSLPKTLTDALFTTFTANTIEAHGRGGLESGINQFLNQNYQYKFK